MGNVLLSLQNNTLSRANLSDESGIAKNVHYGDVLIKFGEVLDVRKEKLPMITDENVLSKYKASFLQNGDVIVADTAEDSTVGKCSEIAGLNDEVVLSGLHTIPYRPIEKFASGYLGYYLNSGAYHNQLIPLMQGIKVTSISKSAMQNTDIDYPKSQEEQGKIGAYFKSLDEMITLHQRKCYRFIDIALDAWEQRKVSEIGNIVTGSTPKTSISDNYGGEFLFVSPADIQENRYVDETITTLTKKGFDQGRKIREKASLFVSIGSTIGKVAQTSQESTTNQQINAVEPYDNFDDDFIFTSLENISGSIKAIASNQAVPIVNKTTFGETEIKVPSELAEQQKIGAYFRNLDHLITLHQRKCEETKSLKKYMLQKMFPENGKCVPKIRFSGFSDDWEQRKVGNFLTESREVGHKGDVAHKMTVKLWSKGICEKNEAGSSNTQYFIRHTGQFIYSKLDFLNCAFGVVPKNLESFETTADVPAFDCNEINPYFMFYTAIQPAFYKKNGIIADGSRKAKRIHVETFLNMPFFIPNLEEQNKIVDALSSLDHLITLHQHKCDELQKLKKFMLQNMFV